MNTSLVLISSGRKVFEMTRQRLKKMSKNRQYTFLATVSIINKYHIMIRNVINTEDNRIVAEHVWISANKRTDKLNLKADDKIKFKGQIRDYWRGQRGDITVDFGIKHINSMMKAEDKQS